MLSYVFLHFYLKANKSKSIYQILEIENEKVIMLCSTYYNNTNWIRLMYWFADVGSNWPIIFYSYPNDKSYKWADVRENCYDL